MRPFNSFILSLAFKQCEVEYCLYTKITENGTIYVLIYVDDLLLAGSDKNQIKDFKLILQKHFKVKDLGFVRHFLGMLIEQHISEGVIKISQTAYLKNVLKRFNMNNCKPVKTPMEVNFNYNLLKRETSESSEIESKCRAAICLLSRFQSCASENLWIAIKRVLRYIQGTVDLKLVFDTSSNDVRVLEGCRLGCR